MTQGNVWLVSDYLVPCKAFPTWDLDNMKILVKVSTLVYN